MSNPSDSLREQIDRIITAMLVIPNTGGEVHNHTPSQVREAKQALRALIKAHSLQEQRNRLDKIYTYMPSAKEVFAMCRAKDVDGLYGVIENVDTEIAWNIGEIDKQLEADKEML